MVDPRTLERLEGAPTPPRAPLPRGAILAGALSVGFAADLLLRAPSDPGANLFLLFLTLAGALALVVRAAGLPLSGEARGWIAAGLLLSTSFLFRASPALHALAFLSAAAAFAFPALRAGGRWLRRCGVSEPLEAVAGAVLSAAFGALRMGRGRPGGPEAGEGMAGQGGRGVNGGTRGGFPAVPGALGGLARGLLLALPLLLVFGSLFTSADPVFASLVTELLRVVAPGDLASHLLVIGALGWLTAGYLSGFVSGTGVRRWIPPLGAPPSLGILETGLALALVNLLFLAFVGVQFHSLFGGRTLVEVTPGLTYAEYAREGFAQLLVAAALVLPSLLAMDWFLRRRSPRDEALFRILAGLQLLLLGLVIASAMERVRLYQVAYGLTESRFYGGAFLAWLAVLTAWFAVTVLRGRRAGFTSFAVISAYVLAAGLLVVNPDERIARMNLAREGEVDVAYLGTLSADAVPALLQALPELPHAAGCPLAEALHRRWGGAAAGDWRNWSPPEARARREVARLGLTPPCSPRPPDSTLPS